MDAPGSNFHLVVNMHGCADLDDRSDGYLAAYLGGPPSSGIDPVHGRRSDDGGRALKACTVTSGPVRRHLDPSTPDQGKTGTIAGVAWGH